MCFVVNLLDWLNHSLIKNPNNIKKNDVFRKRTATEIIESDYASGCTDKALVFVALSRIKGIPTKYVETIDNKLLETGDNNLRGHVFAKVYISKKEYLVDPENGSISVITIPNKSQYTIVAEGLDSWDIGINNFDDLRKVFQDFNKRMS